MVITTYGRATRYLYSKIKFCTFKPPVLHTKQLLRAVDLTVEDIIVIIKTAADLKAGEIETARQKTSGKILSAILFQPCVRFQCCVFKACQLTDVRINTINHPTWHMFHRQSDLAQLISINSDLILCNTNRLMKLLAFSKGCNVPLINIGTCKFAMFQILADLLTIQEHFSNFNGLDMAFIGKAGPYIDNYLKIAPKFGINVKFICEPNGNPLPTIMDIGKGLSIIKECRTIPEVLESANIIVVNDHKTPNLRITIEDVKKYASKDWIFFHFLPRTDLDVDEQVFQNSRNFLWKSYENCTWICAALIKLFLS